MLRNVVFDKSVNRICTRTIQLQENGRLISYCLAGKLWLFYCSLQVTRFLSSYFTHHGSRYRWEANVKMYPPPQKKKYVSRVWTGLIWIKRGLQALVNMVLNCQVPEKAVKLVT
jgi:hypothetical protein